MSITMKCAGLKSSDATIILPIRVELRDRKVVCIYTDVSEAEYESPDAARTAHKAIDPYDGRDESGKLVLFSAGPDWLELRKVLAEAQRLIKQDKWTQAEYQRLLPLAGGFHADLRSTDARRTLPFRFSSEHDDKIYTTFYSANGDRVQPLDLCWRSPSSRRTCLAGSGKVHPQRTVLQDLRWGASLRQNMYQPSKDLPQGARLRLQSAGGVPGNGAEQMMCR